MHLFFNRSFKGADVYNQEVTICKNAIFACLEALVCDS
jgi:hypothetical protein